MGRTWSPPGRRSAADSLTRSIRTAAGKAGGEIKGGEGKDSGLSP